MGRVLRLADDRRVRPASFNNFDEKPVNYHRDIVCDPPRALKPVPLPGLRAIKETSLEQQRLTADVDAARQQGIIEGRALGQEDAVKELSSAFQLLEQYAKTLSAARSELAAKFESQLVTLATQMSEKILAAELSVKPELLTGIVRSALKEVSAANLVTIRVNPQDVTIVKQIAEQLKEILGSSSVLDFRPDETLKRGDCLVDSDIGSLDARLATQLAALREQLETSMEKGE
ncbi:MAG: hypothetical protein H6508_02105 [Calditrichaeota bacterium]|nr:hypothetical protein [Calditrichota bacterium]